MEIAFETELNKSLRKNKFQISNVEFLIGTTQINLNAKSTYGSVYFATFKINIQPTQMRPRNVPPLQSLFLSEKSKKTQRFITSFHRLSCMPKAYQNIINHTFNDFKNTYYF